MMAKADYVLGHRHTRARLSQDGSTLVSVYTSGYGVGLRYAPSSLGAKRPKVSVKYRIRVTPLKSIPQLHEEYKAANGYCTSLTLDLHPHHRMLAELVRTRARLALIRAYNRHRRGGLP